MKKTQNPKKNSTFSQKEVSYMKRSAIATAKRRRKAEDEKFSDELAKGDFSLEAEIDDDSRDKASESSFIENDDFYSLRSNVH